MSFVDLAKAELRENRIINLESEVLQLRAEIERLKKALRVYHYDSKERGGQTDYQSIATKALTEINVYTPGKPNAVLTSNQ